MAGPVGYKSDIVPLDYCSQEHSNSCIQYCIVLSCIDSWLSLIVFVRRAGSDAVHSRQLLIGPADVDAKLGDTVVLECAAKKYDAADTSSVTWSRDGQCFWVSLLLNCPFLSHFHFISMCLPPWEQCGRLYVLDRSSVCVHVYLSVCAFLLARYLINCLGKFDRFTALVLDCEVKRSKVKVISRPNIDR